MGHVAKERQTKGVDYVSSTYSRSRDARVLDSVEQFRYMKTDQVAALHFTSIKDSDQRQKKASIRLKRLFDRGFLTRMRVPGESFIYAERGRSYTAKTSHYLALVDVWLALLKSKPNGANLYCEIEKKTDNVVTDMVIEYTNQFTKEVREYYIEVELDSSADVREKISKYEWLLLHRRSEGKKCVLVVIYKNERTKRQIDGLEVKKDLRVYSLQGLEKEWSW